MVTVTFLSAARPTGVRGHRLRGIRGEGGRPSWDKADLGGT